MMGPGIGEKRSGEAMWAEHAWFLFSQRKMWLSAPFVPEELKVPHDFSVLVMSPSLQGF